MAPPLRPNTRYLKSIDEVRALADPLRLQVLIQLEQPKTAKQIAEVLRVPVTRLYYHLRRLEEHGLIKVVRRRLVSGIEEKTYKSVGNTWNLSPKMWASRELTAEAISAFVDIMKTELSVTAGGPSDAKPGEPASSVPLLTLTRLALSEEQMRSFIDRVSALVDEFVCADSVPPPGTDLFHFFVAAYRPPAFTDDAARA